MKKSLFDRPVTYAHIVRAMFFVAVFAAGVAAGDFAFHAIQESNDREVALTYFQKGVHVGFREGSGAAEEFCSHGYLQIVDVDEYPDSVNCIVPIKLLDDVRRRQ